jgi:AraC-like DNA-binding protein
MAELGSSRWVPQPLVLGSANNVLLARSRFHSVTNLPGPLSIKTVLEGKVAWRTGNRQVWVDESSFLVLNDGEPYSMQIESLEPVTTCCAFFRHGFVESIRADLSIPAFRRLDDTAGGLSISFLSYLHPCNRELSARMAALRRTCEDPQAMELDEQFLALGVQLVLEHKESEKRIGQMPATRASTRTELFTRAARGREFLHAEAFNQVTLATAARAACMSEFHFHRTFLKAFGKTPSRYVSDLRLQRAAQLIANGVPVTETCLRVGFESLGSFSAKFRKHFGVAPSAFRRN